jgi:type II secretory pathway pseudopilin PulG
MRPSSGLLLVLMIFSLLVGALMVTLPARRAKQEENFRMLQQVVLHFGLSDLSLSTEARYTRHPAVSDPVVVSMDHPGAIDHFPSTFFWAPVR